MSGWQIDYALRHKARIELGLAYLGGKCSVEGCAETTRLHFDHIDPSTKKYHISGSMTLKDETFFEELVKCQLLCPSHHAQKTAREYQPKRAATKTRQNLEIAKIYLALAKITTAELVANS